jgi:hypothetical protein
MITSETRTKMQILGLRTAANEMLDEADRMEAALKEAGVAVKNHRGPDKKPRQVGKRAKPVPVDTKPKRVHHAKRSLDRWTPKDDKYLLETKATHKQRAKHLGRTPKACQIRLCYLRRKNGTSPLAGKTGAAVRLAVANGNKGKK